MENVYEHLVEKPRDYRRVDPHIVVWFAGTLAVEANAVMSLGMLNPAANVP
jgi:hypothetical protein